MNTSTSIPSDTDTPATAPAKRPARKRTSTGTSTARKTAAQPAATVEVTAAPAAPVETQPAVVPEIPQAPEPAPAPAEEPSPTAKPGKGPTKVKLIRDSFTFPESDYALIDQLKQRALGLSHHAKKSEILRAGLLTLSVLSDELLLARLQAVHTLKTGRPKADKAGKGDKPPKELSKKR